MEKSLITKKNATVSIGYQGEPASEVYLVAENLDFDAYSPREQVSDKNGIPLQNMKRTLFSMRMTTGVTGKRAKKQL